MNSAPQRQILLTALGCVIALALVWLFSQFEGHNFRERSRITVGLIYYGDESIAYTRNFIQAQHQLEVEFGSRIATVALRNVPEADVATHLQWLIDQGCNLIVTTSYGYSKVAREMAQRHPGVVFCQATGDNANLEPLVPNYHTFMGSIYQGRYATGVAAGLKLKELIDKGALTPDKAVLGYVAAYPVPEVISGYTAFLLGARSIVPEAVMRVKYIRSWNNFVREKEAAQMLFNGGAVVVGQHCDTIAAAIAAEEIATRQLAFHVGYNQSMVNVAPTSSLVSTRNNWYPYLRGAVQAMLAGKRIEDVVPGRAAGNDMWSGFDNDWVQLVEVNHAVAASETDAVLGKLVEDFRHGFSNIFRGDYEGVRLDGSPCSLRPGFHENATRSAPAFDCVLNDVITIVP